MRMRNRLCCALLLALFAASSSGARATTLYVVRRGWHTDVGFAVGDLGVSLSRVSAEFPGIRYLFFSFGDRRYLMAREQHIPLMVAALWPGRGLILATALRASPDAAFGDGHVVRLEVTGEQARAAQEFIAKSILPDAPLPGPYDGSLYLATAIRYSALHTCNTWSAQALHAAEPSIHTGGVLFAGQVWRAARRTSASNAASSSGQATADGPASHRAD